jgi:hypothetical protein
VRVASAGVALCFSISIFGRIAQMTHNIQMRKCTPLQGGGDTIVYMLANYFSANVTGQRTFIYTTHSVQRRGAGAAVRAGTQTGNMGRREGDSACLECATNKQSLHWAPPQTGHARMLGAVIYADADAAAARKLLRGGYASVR